MTYERLAPAARASACAGRAPKQAAGQVEIRRRAGQIRHDLRIAILDVGRGHQRLVRHHDRRARWTRRDDDGHAAERERGVHVLASMPGHAAGTSRCRTTRARSAPTPRRRRRAGAGGIQSARSVGRRWRRAMSASPVASVADRPCGGGDGHGRLRLAPVASASGFDAGGDGRNTWTRDDDHGNHGQRRPSDETGAAIFAQALRRRDGACAIAVGSAAAADVECPGRCDVTHDRHRAGQHRLHQVRRDRFGRR